MSKPLVYVSMRGLPGSGKTSIVRALQAGCASLVHVPLLQEAAREGFAVWTEDTLPSHVLSEALSELTQGSDYLISDGMAAMDDVLALSDGHRVAVVVVVARPWLRRARVDMRFRYYMPQEWERKAAEDADAVSVVDCFLDYPLPPGGQYIWVDASDYPIREVGEEEARQITSESTPSQPTLPATECYHPALRVGGEWCGTDDEIVREETARRLATILPDNIAGHSVLDVGGAYGLFAWEAVQRGASYVMLLERDERCGQFVRQMRDNKQMPVSVCTTDIERDRLLPLSVHGYPLRYDVALLLNVLHHCLDPEAAFANVLSVCDSCVVETPFCQGTAPTFVTDTTYPQKPCLPPWWVERQAEANGFCVTSIENSQMHPGYRIIIRLKRPEVA
jgi:SAM-dependent methyltransferase